MTKHPSSRLSLDVTGLLQFSFDAYLKTRFLMNGILSLCERRCRKGPGVIFLTPLVCYISGGFGLKIPEFGSLNLVCVSKATYLCDRSVF